MKLKKSAASERSKLYTLYNECHRKMVELTKLDTEIKANERSVKLMDQNVTHNEVTLQQLDLELVIATDIYHDNLSLYDHANCEKVIEATCMCTNDNWALANIEKLFAVAREINRLK